MQPMVSNHQDNLLARAEDAVTSARYRCTNANLRPRNALHVRNGDTVRVDGGQWKGAQGIVEMARGTEHGQMLGIIATEGVKAPVRITVYTSRTKVTTLLCPWAPVEPRLPLIQVHNLATGKSGTYETDPETAVLNAYAFEQGDRNVAQYRKRYGHLIVKGAMSVACGDWSAQMATPLSPEDLGTQPWPDDRHNDKYHDTGWEVDGVTHHDRSVTRQYRLASGEYGTREQAADERDLVFIQEGMHEGLMHLIRNGALTDRYSLCGHKAPDNGWYLAWRHLDDNGRLARPWPLCGTCERALHLSPHVRVAQPDADDWVNCPKRSDHQARRGSLVTVKGEPMCGACEKWVARTDPRYLHVATMAQDMANSRACSFHVLYQRDEDRYHFVGDYSVHHMPYAQWPIVGTLQAGGHYGATFSRIDTPLAQANDDGWRCDACGKHALPRDRSGAALCQPCAMDLEPPPVPTVAAYAVASTEPASPRRLRLTALRHR